MSLFVYQCGSRTSLTLLGPTSESNHTDTTPTQNETSTGFESPSPIAQDPSLHSSWLPPPVLMPTSTGATATRTRRLPLGRRNPLKKAIKDDDSYPLKSTSQGEREGQHIRRRGKCVSPLLSPSPDSRSSAEYTQENVTASHARSQPTSQGPSVSQETAYQTPNITYLDGKPLSGATQNGKRDRSAMVTVHPGEDPAGTGEDKAEHSAPLQCSSIQVLMATASHLHSSNMPELGRVDLSRTATDGFSTSPLSSPEAATLLLQQQDLKKNPTQGATIDEEVAVGLASNRGVSVPSSNVSVMSPEPVPERPVNSMEGRALFLGDVTPSSYASSVTSISTVTAPTKSVLKEKPPVDSRWMSDEQTPIKQSLSLIRSQAATTSVVSAHEVDPAQTASPVAVSKAPVRVGHNAYDPSVMAVAYTPDSVHRAWRNKHKVAVLATAATQAPEASAKRLPSEGGAGGGRTPGALEEVGSDDTGEVESDKGKLAQGHSPQRIPSYLATPNPCVFDGYGYTPDTCLSNRRRSLSHAPLGGSCEKEAPLDFDDPEATPVSRFTGFPSPVKLSPIPTKGNQADLFRMQQVSAHHHRTCRGDIDDRSPWREASASAPSAKRATQCDGDTQFGATAMSALPWVVEGDFQPEYNSSTGSSEERAIPREDCRQAQKDSEMKVEEGTQEEPIDSMISETQTFLPCASPASVVDHVSFPASPTSPFLVPVRGLSTDRPRVATDNGTDRTAASVSHFFNPTDTTQPPVENDSEQASSLAAGRMKATDKSSVLVQQHLSHLGSADVTQGSGIDKGTQHGGSFLDRASDIISFAEALPSWTAFPPAKVPAPQVTKPTESSTASASLNAPTPAVSAIVSGSYHQVGGLPPEQSRSDDPERSAASALPRSNALPSVPVLSPTMDTSGDSEENVARPSDPRLYFSALPIPGLRASEASLACDSGHPVAIPCREENSDTLPGTITSAVADEVSSPSKLFLDYYYASAGARRSNGAPAGTSSRRPHDPPARRRQMEGRKENAKHKSFASLSPTGTVVSPAWTDLSLSMHGDRVSPPSAWVSKGPTQASHVDPVQTCPCVTGASTDVRGRPEVQMLFLQNSEVADRPVPSGSTVFETVSSIRSRSPIREDTQVSSAVLNTQEGAITPGEILAKPTAKAAVDDWRAYRATLLLRKSTATQSSQRVKSPALLRTERRAAPLQQQRGRSEEVKKRASKCQYSLDSFL